LFSLLVAEGENEPQIFYYQEDEKMKRIFKLMAMFMTMVCISATVATTAAATVPIEPFSNETHSLDLTFSGNVANCNLTITGAAGTTRIDNVNIMLRDNHGTVVREWRNLSANGMTFRWSGTASPVVVGRTYTLSFTATVHRNGTATPIGGQISRLR
jgi:hypothetical protein